MLSPHSDKQPDWSNFNLFIVSKLPEKEEQVEV